MNLNGKIVAVQGKSRKVMVFSAGSKRRGHANIGIPPASNKQRADCFHMSTKATLLA